MLFTLRSSISYVLMLISVHLLVIVVILRTDILLWARIGIVLLVMCSLLFQLYRYKRFRWHRIFLNEHRVAVITPGGSALEGELARQTVVTARCVVLCVRLAGHALPVCQVIFPMQCRRTHFASCVYACDFSTEVDELELVRLLSEIQKMKIKFNGLFLRYFLL